MYQKLPSEIAAQATTFDLMVTDVYSAWEKHKTNPGDADQYREEELLSVFRGVSGG